MALKYKKSIQPQQNLHKRQKYHTNLETTIRNKNTLNQNICYKTRTKVYTKQHENFTSLLLTKH